MSFDFRTIQKPSADPILAFIAELQKQAGLALAKDQVGQLDDSEDIYSDSNDVETKISLNTLLAQQVFRFTKLYYPPKDPGRMAPLWLRGYNTGSTLRDFSQFNHPATILGEPLLVDGTMDLGIYDESVNLKSIALRFNRPTSPDVNLEALQVPDHTDLQIASLVGGQGFSVFFRFRLKDLATQGGFIRTIWEKIDDSTPNDAHMLQVVSDGTILVIVKKGGVTTAKFTGVGVISADVIYAGFVTFAVTGNVVKLYTWVEDGTPTPTVTDHTLSNYGGAVNWHSTLTNHDFNVFRRGLGTAGGYVYGDLYDLELYKPDSQTGFTGIVSSVEAGYRSINKMSISNIPFGCIMIANHWATADMTPFTASFTSASFSPTSFNT